MSDVADSLNPVIAVYATRYAAGRRSGAAQDVARFIHAHLSEIRADAGCRHAILHAIAGAPSLGDPCDEREWRQVETALREGDG